MKGGGDISVNNIFLEVPNFLVNVIGINDGLKVFGTKTILSYYYMFTIAEITSCFESSIALSSLLFTNTKKSKT